MDLELNSHDIGDMPIGGKEAFLSKVTFRRESKWYSKTKQMLKDMKSIEERAVEKYCTHCGSRFEYNCSYKQTPCESIKNYIEIATEQKAIGDTELAKLKKELLLATTFAVKAKEKEIVDKACKCFCDVCGCKECVKRNVACTEYKAFRKALEDKQ